MNTKALMAVFVAVAMIGSAFAQGAGPQAGGPGQGKGGKRGPGGPMGRRGGPMNFDGPVLDKVNLNATQKSQVKTLKEKLGKDMKAAFDKNQGNREAMRTAMKGVGKSYRDGLMKILTPAQQKQYKSLMKAEMEKRRKEMGNRRGGPGGPGGPPPSGN